MNHLVELHQQIANDPAAGALGIQLVDASTDHVTVRMTVQPTMRNGFGIVHGGYIFLLADTALAYACTAAGSPAVTHHASVTFIAPAANATHLDATAQVQHSYGRNSICAVTVTDNTGTIVADFRGNGVNHKPVTSPAGK